MSGQRTMSTHDSLIPVRSVMIGLASTALIAFLAALTRFDRLPQATPPIIHVIMAIGIMPLIMGAMIYFTPVLTHSRPPSWPILLAPLLALIAGVMVTVALIWRRDLLFMPAVLATFAAGTLLGWMWRRAHTMLGRPHPGLHWYLWALTSLLLGLIAIFIATLRPEYWIALRRFHLHLNLLGFIGLTAMGTLRVLIPTVAGYADSETRSRLHGDLYPMAAGALLIAAGSAWWTWLVWPGVVLWLIPLMRFALPLVSRWRKSVWGWHRAGTPLGFAVFGLMFVLITGGLHAAGTGSAGTSVQLFFFIFLFPLVTGAVSYLLPVWLWPARNNPEHETIAQQLAWGSGMRSLFFLLAGVMAWRDMTVAVYLAVAAVAVFLMQIVWAILARFFRRI